QGVTLVSRDAAQALEFSAGDFRSTIPHPLPCFFGTHDEVADLVPARESEAPAVPRLLDIAPEVWFADHLVNRKLFKRRSRRIDSKREQTPPHTPESGMNFLIQEANPEVAAIRTAGQKAHGGCLLERDVESQRGLVPRRVVVDIGSLDDLGAVDCGDEIIDGVAVAGADPRIPEGDPVRVRIS